MLYLSPLTYHLHTRTFRPPRALTHVENYWTNELINPFLLKSDVTYVILTMNTDFVFWPQPLPIFFIGEFERKALKGYVDKPFLCLRCIDDILMVWTHGNEKFESFIAHLNRIHPTIKFTSERSTTSIPFLARRQNPS